MSYTVTTILTVLIGLILRDPRCRLFVEITVITDWMAFDRLMSGYGHRCRLNRWHKRSPKAGGIISFSEIASFLLFLQRHQRSSRPRLEIDNTYLPASKSIESFLVRSCNPQIFHPTWVSFTLPILHWSNQDTISTSFLSSADSPPYYVQTPSSDRPNSLPRCRVRASFDSFRPATSLSTPRSK